MIVFSKSYAQCRNGPFSGPFSANLFFQLRRKLDPSLLCRPKDRPFFYQNDVFRRKTDVKGFAPPGRGYDGALNTFKACRFNLSNPSRESSVAFASLPKKKRSQRLLLFFGRGGIRTPGTLRHSCFQDRRIRPLCHSSKMQTLYKS